MNDDELSARIREHASRYSTGPRLRADIRARIALESATETHPAARPARRGAIDRVSDAASSLRRGIASLATWPTFTHAAVGFALGVVCMAVGMRVFVSTSLDERPLSMSAATPMADELVSEHVRSLRTGPLLQVASDDRHTVKPWFQGKLDYAPPVLDLSSKGFVLLGARVEQVQGEPVAALVYSYHKHLINLFVWPSPNTQSGQQSQVRGFNVAHWSNGVMQCWAVSDMDSPELERFHQAWYQTLSKV